MMNKKSAINFLIFSYFGISMESEADEVMYAIIDRAYRDASSHVFSAQEGNENKKIEAGRIIKTWLKEQKEPFKGVEEIWKNLKNIYKDDIKFKYGIAQKWVNMTTKYMAVLCYVMDENSPFLNEYKNVVETSYRNFHMPIDRYIMKALSDKKYHIIPKDYRENNDIQVGKYCENGNEKTKSKAWSKWDDKDYEKFREQLKESSFIVQTDCELDWEGDAWIEQAKKKRTFKEKYEA